MNEELLSLNKAEAIDLSENIGQAKGFLVASCKDYTPEKRYLFLSEIAKFVQEEMNKVDKETLFGQLKKKALEEFVRGMYEGKFKEDVAYFMGQSHVITYACRNGEKTGRVAMTGSLTAFGNAIRQLGYIQVHANYVVKISRIQAIDSKFVYLDTMEKVPHTATYQKRFKSELDAIKEKLPKLIIDKQKYREPDLIPIENA